MTSASPNGPEYLGNPIDKANDGIQRAGKKNANDCRMAPNSNSQNESCFKKWRSFGRSAFEAVTGKRPFTNNRHGIRPMA